MLKLVINAIYMQIMYTKDCQASEKSLEEGQWKTVKDISIPPKLWNKPQLISEYSLIETRNSSSEKKYQKYLFIFHSVATIIKLK